MTSRHLCALSIVAIAALSASCAEPPERDLELAKSKIEAARTAEAAKYAPAAMQEATAAEAALQAELASQSSQWFKSFDRASSLAVAAQQSADKATAAAAAGRAALERLLAAARAGDASVTLGPNLFENGDFSAGTKGWFAHPQSDATITVVPAEGARAWHVTYRKSNWAVINQEQVLKPDTVYVYEAWVKSTAPVTSLYWQSDIGRFAETEKTYPAWTRVRNVFVTPHWNGAPLRSSFNPVLLHASGEAWLRDVRISEATSR